MSENPLYTLLLFCLGVLGLFVVAILVLLITARIFRPRRLTYGDVLACASYNWQSVYQHYEEFHRRRKVELGTLISLESVSMVLAYYAQLQVLEKQVNHEITVEFPDNKNGAKGQTEDEATTKAKQTFYRLIREWGEPDRGRRRKPLPKLVWQGIL